MHLHKLVPGMSLIPQSAVELVAVVQDARGDGGSAKSNAGRRAHRVPAHVMELTSRDGGSAKSKTRHCIPGTNCTANAAVCI
eukprot:42088-Rhodomonas_salina.1